MTPLPEILAVDGKYFVAITFIVSTVLGTCPGVAEEARGWEQWVLPTIHNVENRVKRDSKNELGLEVYIVRT